MDGNLDVEETRHNTPDARAALINAPEWTVGKSLATFALRRPVPSEVKEWRIAGVGMSPGIILHGLAGAGKTGLGVSVLRSMASHGVGPVFSWNMATGPTLRRAVEEGLVERRPSPCWFESWPRVLYGHQWTAAVREDNNWLRDVEARVTALMLDDVDVVAGTPFRENLLLMAMEWSTFKPGRALILTCNAAPDAWPVVFGARIADRLADPSRFASVHVPGGSLR